MDKIPAWLRITFKGRINRFRFFWYPFGISLAVLPIYFVLVMMLIGSELLLLTAIPAALVHLYTQVWSVSLLVRRLHDLNRTGWMALLLFIPLVNFVFGIYVVFFKGTDGSNKYGEDPLEYDNYSEYFEASKGKQSTTPDSDNTPPTTSTTPEPTSFNGDDRFKR